MIIPRTTLTMANRQSLANLDRIRERRQQATDEISTGLRLRRPSDAPVEAGGVVRTRNEIESAVRFRATLHTVSEQTRSADSSMNQAIDLVTRAQVLASQAANFNQTAASRAAIGVEIDGVIQQMVTLGNTNLAGKYLFSGRPEETQPFLRDITTLDGVVYRGDQGRRSVALPGGAESFISLDGRALFLNPDVFLGTGRTPGSVGAAAPVPPVGVGITFSNGLSGTITADLPSFFVAAAPPTVPAAGNQITVSFTSTDAAIAGSITTPPLAGGESTAALAVLLNAQVAATPSLAGRITFSDQGGRLKIVESDTVGVGFTFTSSATGGLVTGLESGGVIGGLSAQEITAALNARVAANSSLSAAAVRFTAVSGQVQLDADVSFTFRAVDYPRGTGFVSGLAGERAVGGTDSANVFRVLSDLHRALVANDAPGIQATLEGLGRAVQHLSKQQGFYGAAQRQALTAIDSLNQLDLVNREKLSAQQDADIVGAISNLNEAQTNEEAALRAAARQPGRSLFDFLA